MPTVASQRPPFNSRGNTPARPRGRPPLPSTLTRRANGLTDPPPKKRKYGGTGGSGSYYDSDGLETPELERLSLTAPRAGRDGGVMANGASPSAYARGRPRNTTQRRFSSAAAAAAAAQGEGYKPREEKGWEEFHPDLLIEGKLAVHSADDVDGIVRTTETPQSKSQTPLGGGSAGSPVNGTAGSLVNGIEPPTSGAEKEASVEKPLENGIDDEESTEIVFAAPRRKAGRPRRSEPIVPPVEDAVTPSAPKIVPLPATNPKEKLTLPKPSFRRSDPFQAFEEKSAGQQRYVDRQMANVGYQESDIFERPESQLIKMAEGTIEEDLDLGPTYKSENDTNAALGGLGVGRVEYDMDEQDDKWLAAHNQQRKAGDVEGISREVFEITMTKIEKEWHSLEKQIPKPNPKPPQTHRLRSSSATAVNGEPNIAGGEEQDSKCAICDDGDCENTNAIVFCDGCDLAVHQECYGVPFIPEGQWLCRKCQLIGRGTPTCIFCPNTDGAFKQTNASRWSHLLCAIWIPEVSLGNATFMEPVLDVEKVPKQRWKLMCYICRQKMGACIQCGNKNCFTAFHVTCARKSRLFLKMKSTHGGPASLDASVLKAYCDRHVPPDWRRENDTDSATFAAKQFYDRTMKGRIWADSQQSALAPTVSQTQAQAPGYSIDNMGQPTVSRINLTMGSSHKKKRDQPQRLVWKLPSGAPVVPQIVYNTVETSLQRFMILRRKEYVAEACRYWTLKREARRGAALLKRLQLQMETFSSMEITRRNFSGMGAAGRARLQHRIEFASMVLEELEKLRTLLGLLKEREGEKLKTAELLRDLVFTVYMPLIPLLKPILRKAQILDIKEGVFRQGLHQMQLKLDSGFYTSTALFTADLAGVFSTGIGLEIDEPEPETALEATSQLTNAANAAVDAPEQKEKRRLARRITKAIQPALEEAMRKEAELGLRPYEKELRDLEALLLNGSMLRRESEGEPSDVEMKDANTNGFDGAGMDLAEAEPVPCTDDTTSPDLLSWLGSGGIPWYLRDFDPTGTTIHEERWTGREVLRDMSEELSDMDEDTLQAWGDEMLDEVDEHGGVIQKSKATKKETVDGAAVDHDGIDPNDEEAQKAAAQAAAKAAEAKKKAARRRKARQYF